MAIKSKPKPALFLHIQKTAGSSIVDLARLAYGSENVISHGDYLSLTPNVAFEAVDNISGVGARLPVAKSGISKYQNVPFVSGHFGFDYAKPLIANRYSFTFLRDPIERVLSCYYFFRTRDPKEYEVYALAQQLTLDEFLMLGIERPVVKSFIWNNQAQQIADGYASSNKRNILSFPPEEILELAIKHLDYFSYIGFAETFETDRDHILKALGIVPPKEKVVSNANPERPKANSLPDSTLKLLNELTHLDRALYQEAWRRKNSILEIPFNMMRKLKRRLVNL